jgi:restriction system protein
MQYLSLAVIGAVVIGYAVYFVFAAIGHSAGLISDGVSGTVASFSAKRAAKAAQIEKANTEARAADDEAKLHAFRERNPVRLIGIPNPQAFESAFQDLDSYTRAANSCRPSFQSILDVRYEYARFPTNQFALKRSHPDSLSPMEPIKLSVTAEDLSMSNGEPLGTLYETARSAFEFPHTDPICYVENFEIPTFPKLADPPRTPVKLVASDNSEVDTRPDFVRRAYAPEVAKVVALNNQKSHLLNQFDAKHAAATEARELLDLYITNFQLHLRDSEAALHSNFEQSKAAYERDRDSATTPIRSTYERYLQRDARGVRNHFILALCNLQLPLPDTYQWDVFYDQSERILQVNQCVPAIADISVRRTDGNRAPAKRDVEFVLRRYVPAIALQLAHQIAVNDLKDNVDTIAVNCWCRFFEPSSGRIKDAFVASLAAPKDNVLDLVLERADPLEAFRALRGTFVFSAQDVVPIEPAIRLDKSDDRFVAGREVLDGMAQGQNLSTMDWQEFEHLIRELLAKEFSSANSDVKITRASRDRGVDAVIFNSDPLHGGKIVVQAKRYTNAVDVAAVRELYGTVMSEGANRGILVTTSHYGRDAYEWAANKPLTLMDGPNLLSLLSKHGYRFTIDISKL